MQKVITTLNAITCLGIAQAIHFGQRLSASSDSCACVGLGTSSAHVTCSVPCDIHTAAYDTGVYQDEVCKTVNTLLIEEGRELVGTGNDKDITNFLNAIETVWYYAQIEHVSTRFFVKQYRVNVFALDKISIQSRQVCRMYYNVTDPVYDNETITDYATLVNSPLEGIEYIKMNEAGEQLQLVDMQGRTQLMQSSLILLSTESPLSVELLSKLANPQKSQMSQNMFLEISMVYGFHFSDTNRNLGQIGFNLIDVQQICSASVTAPLKSSDQCPRLQPCAGSESLWYRQGQYDHTFYYSGSPCYTQDYVLTQQGSGFLTPLLVQHDRNCNFTYGGSNTVDQDCVFPNFSETQPSVIAPPTIIEVPKGKLNLKEPFSNFMTIVVVILGSFISLLLVMIIVKVARSIVKSRKKAKQEEEAEARVGVPLVLQQVDDD